MGADGLGTGFVAGMIFTIMLALLIAPAASSSTFTVPNTFLNNTEADADEVNANFTAAKTAIDDNDARLDLVTQVVWADLNESGSATGGIQEALDSCGSGVAGSTPSLGCIVRAPCGEVSISSTILIGGNSDATGKRGVTLRGCGGGGVNSGGYSVGGTVLRWTGSPTEEMITVQGCSDCSIEDISLDGEDSAGVGLYILAGADPGPPTSRLFIKKVSIYNVDGEAIWLPDVTNAGQADYLYALQLNIAGSDQCYRQDAGAQVHNHLASMRCSSLTGDDANMVEVNAGELTISNSYFGIKNTGEVAVDVNAEAQLYALYNRIEIQGDNATVFKSDGTSGTRDTISIIGNAFRNFNANPTCIDWDRRGHLLVQGNSFAGINAGDNIACALNATSTVGDLWVHSSGNSHRAMWEAADFGSGTLDYDYLPWTVGSNTIVFDDVSVPDDSVDADSMADDDFGDFTCASGVCSLDGSAPSAWTGTHDFGGATFELPNSTDCSGVTAEGRVCWDSDNDTLYIGNGSSAVAIGP